ncbi:MAG: hypothetical protein M1814_002377 [Vezdaea aestivalis]|nr:MAG: hypothetical protein M1814_002377 [Vezdaea aestivalis]
MSSSTSAGNTSSQTLANQGEPKYCLPTRLPHRSTEEPNLDELTQQLLAAMAKRAKDCWELANSLPDRAEEAQAEKAEQKKRKAEEAAARGEEAPKRRKKS